MIDSKVNKWNKKEKVDKEEVDEEKRKYLRRNRKIDRKIRKQNEFNTEMNKINNYW